MKKSTTLLLFVFIGGLLVFLYPTVSDYYNSFHQSRSIAEYKGEMDGLSDEEFTAIRKAAEGYNKKLAEKNARFYEGEPFSEEYRSILNVTDDGMIGYLSIETIGVDLPIYHGTSEAVLTNGAGHLEGSSFPIGGESTHAVITSHRGLPSAKLFTNLDKLKEGDVFRLHILNETLAYEADQILIVEPEDTSALDIIEGEDLCTLVTCTPYGVNSHRLLVRGHRIEENKEHSEAKSDAERIDPALTASVLALMVLTLLLLGLTVRTRKRSPRRFKGE